jgi:hypothetical protein
MLFYKIHLEGTANEIKSMIGEMTNYDERFQSDELGTDFDFMEDGNPEISNIEEVEQMADTLKSAAPDAKFKIMGTVENHDYFMDFEMEDGTYYPDAVRDALTKAWEAADERAKEFIRRPYECFLDWERFIG